MKDFSSIAAPLYDFLKTKANWEKNEHRNTAFRQLKILLCFEAIVLALPNNVEEFELFTNASDVGLDPRL